MSITPQCSVCDVIDERIAELPGGHYCEECMKEVREANPNLKL